MIFFIPSLVNQKHANLHCMLTNMYHIVSLDFHSWIQFKVLSPKENKTVVQTLCKKFWNTCSPQKEN